MEDKDMPFPKQNAQYWIDKTKTQNLEIKICLLFSLMDYIYVYVKNFDLFDLD